MKGPVPEITPKQPRRRRPLGLMLYGILTILAGIALVVVAD